SKSRLVATSAHPASGRSSITYASESSGFEGTHDRHRCFQERTGGPDWASVAVGGRGGDAVGERDVGRRATYEVARPLERHEIGCVGAVHGPVAGVGGVDRPHVGPADGL